MTGHLTNLFATIIVFGISAYVALYSSVLFKRYVIKDFKLHDKFDQTSIIAQVLIFLQAIVCVSLELSILRMKLGILPPGWSPEINGPFPGKLAGIDINLLMWVTLAASLVFFWSINYSIAKDSKRNK